MPLTITNIVFDCADPKRLAEFWAAALGYPTNTEHEAHAWAFDPAGSRPRLLFNQVPEPKSVKNRVHLDLGTEDVKAEVERLVRLVARKVRFVEEAYGGWWIMADPEGNEFCVP
jgi:predicted enzyme related to lactoylglutathione lyase